MNIRPMTSSLAIETTLNCHTFILSDPPIPPEVPPVVPNPDDPVPIEEPPEPIPVPRDPPPEPLRA
jgi:hypothetical protein